MGTDLRLAIRTLFRDRGYAVTVIATLGICFGANVAVFTVVNSVLLRPLSVQDGDRIVLMGNEYPNAGAGTLSINSSAPDYFDRLRTMTVFEEQAMHTVVDLAFDIDGTSELVRGMAATPSLLRMLRVVPLHGRAFEERDGEADASDVILLSDGLWQQAFGGAADIVGSPVRIAGRVFTVIGVMPPRFQYYDPDARFWVPLRFTDRQRSDAARHSNNWVNVARLRSGATMQQAQTQVDALNAANLDLFPNLREILINAGFRTRVSLLQDVLVRDVRAVLYLLWGGAGFLLLVGVLNVANLSVARATLRAKEFSVRMALGAARRLVARRMVAEGVVVALASAVSGTLAGYVILRVLHPLGLERLPRAADIQLDVAVLAAATGVALLTGVLIGVASLVYLPQVNLSHSLQEGGRSGTGGRRVRSVRRVLVVTEIALAFILLVGASLLAASFRNLTRVDPGFKGEGVVTASFGIPRARYPEDDGVRAVTRRALEAVRRVPGVVSAGVTTLVPLSGNHSDSVILAEGYQMQSGESLVSPLQALITPGYFESMGTRLVRGRDFTERDDETHERVVIVDERLARKFWPGQDPIGRRMYQPGSLESPLVTDENTQWLTVVGVVEEVRLEDLADRFVTSGAFYFPAAQVVPRVFTLVLKTAGDPLTVVRDVRVQLRSLDPELPLSNVQTMIEYTSLALLPRRAAMLLTVAFGVVSLLLAAVGTYGVLAYLVAQRSREFGIRMALGSTAGGIVELVLREGVLLVVAGCVLGLAGAVTLRAALNAQLYGIDAMNPYVLVSTVLVLAGIGLTACTLPARRAAAVHPADVLNP